MGVCVDFPKYSIFAAHRSLQVKPLCSKAFFRNSCICTCWLSLAVSIVIPVDCHSNIKLQYCIRYVFALSIILTSTKPNGYFNLLSHLANIKDFFKPVGYIKLMAKFTDRLKELREEKNLTQEDSNETRQAPIQRK